jgi:trk system potassium uptake protein TrkH
VGSTAGGLKVFRLLIGTKHLGREVRRLRHRQGVFPLKLGPDPVPEEIVASAFGFLILFFGLVLVGTMLVSATGSDLLTSASATISAMSNMGPALGEAGPTSNFLVFTRPARLILAALMLIGRLEIYAVMLMFASTARRYTHGRRRLRHGREPVRLMPKSRVQLPRVVSGAPGSHGQEG